MDFRRVHGLNTRGQSCGPCPHCTLSVVPASSTTPTLPHPSHRNSPNPSAARDVGELSQEYGLCVLVGIRHCYFGRQTSIAGRGMGLLQFVVGSSEL